MRRPISDFIPDLSPLFEAVRDLVAFAQGEKGYIDTQDQDCDSIFSIEFSEDVWNGVETRVHGVRVHDGDIEVLTHGDVGRVQLVYDEADFKAPDAEWMSVRLSDTVYFIPTIFNLAENLEEYIPAEILDRYYSEE